MPPAGTPFTDEEVVDVTKTVLGGLGIDFTTLTDEQKSGFTEAARGALTGARPTGFTAGIDPKHDPAALETEFWKFARDEFDRRRS
jgi:hypothetical protein